MSDDPSTQRWSRAGGRAPRGAVALGLFAGLVVSLVAACEAPEDEPAAEQQATQEPEPGGTAVLCVPSRPGSLDPFVTPDQRASDLAPLLFTPLVRYRRNGDIAPYLARSWRWEDGRRRLILRLRDDLRWHDGARVTAEDVAWTLRVAAQPDYGYPEAADFSTLRATEVRDSTTVVVRFSEPYAAGPEPLTMVPILPEHRLGDLPAGEFTRAPYHRSPVGSGPYRFVERRDDGTLVFERFDRFPDELGPARLDRIAVRVIPETGSMVAAFRQGAVDACVAGSGAADRLQTLRQVELSALRPAQVQVIALDTGHPPFGDPRVRRALSAALDRASIAAAVSPLSSPAGTPLPANSPRRVPGLAQPDRDPALADSLLSAAGWTRSGEGAIRRNGTGDRLRFTLTAPSALRDALTVVQSDLREVGVDVELRFMEPSAFFGRLRTPESRPAAMALGFQLQSLKRPDLYGMFHSGGTSNLSGYADPRVDSLLDIAASSLDPDRVQQAYRELQREISHDVPLIFTVYAPRVLATGPRLRGVKPAPNAPLANVAEWWIPAGRRR